MAILFQAVAIFDRIILSLLMVWGVGVYFWVTGSLAAGSTTQPIRAPFLIN
jgi:hypothetical protein